jgi:Zn-dependent protease
MLAISLHEAAHGFVAYKLGDPTAKSVGRLSLNPAKHFDVIGFIMLIFLGFGWAKPVPIDTRNFKNPKRDMAISAIAGPLSNLTLALVFAIFFKIYYEVSRSPEFDTILLNTPWRILGIFLYYGIRLNIMFAVFNLLPIPPFDGSRLLLAFLPTRIYFKIQRYERYIFIALIVLLFTGLLNVPLNFCIEKITDLYMWIFDIPWALPIGLLASLLY